MRHLPLIFKTFFEDDDFFSPVRNDFSPKTDIKETESSFTLDLEIPGVDKKDVKLNIEDGYLTVSGKKTYTKEDKKSQYLRKESFEGSFSRSFYIGDKVNLKSIEAKMDNGILNVVIPKKKDLKNSLDVKIK